MTAVPCDNFRDSKDKTDAFLDWMRGKGKGLIIIHDHPDPDSLASAMALRHLLTMKLNRDTVIAFSGAISRSENIAMARKLEICLTPLETVNIGDYSMICMLDTQPGTGNNSLPPGVTVDLVIDHHPIRESTRECRWVDIRETYGTSATILYEYLMAQGVSIGTKLATALFYAIKSETQDLGREAGEADRNAYLTLFPLTNKKLLYEITHPKLPQSHFRAMHKALKNAVIYSNLLIITMGKSASPEVVSEMADYLVRLEGVDVVMSLGQYKNALVLSMRTTRLDLNAGEIMKKLVSGQGTAGGHGMTAGGRIDLASASPAAFHGLENSLTQQLLVDLGIPPCTPRALISSR
ncbi:MAG: DHHA1 domain-containing protein [Geobacteraceae bacterium]|nr:DHHA1 domain-containing protein [Geobacteraceae bacterium]